MVLALYAIILFIWLLFTQEVFRRFQSFALAFFVILPFILIPYCLDNGIIKDWFTWVKIFSVFFALIWASIFRLTSFGETMLAKMGMYIIFVVNILEAVIRDASSGGTANYLNAIAGILLIATLNKFDSINTSKDKYLDVNWDGMTLMWIIGNTIWDWTFVYLNFVNVSALNIAVLGVPLVIAFFDKARWVQVRTITLGTYLFSYLFLFSELNPFIYSGFWKNELFGYVFASISCAFMVAYAAIFFRSNYLEKRSIN